MKRKIVINDGFLQKFLLAESGDFEFIFTNLVVNFGEMLFNSDPLVFLVFFIDWIPSAHVRIERLRGIIVLSEHALLVFYLRLRE